MNAATKILVTAIGAPRKGYSDVNWNFGGKTITEPLPFMLVAAEYEVDRILILGTQESFNPESVHYLQLGQALQKYGFADRNDRLTIGALNSREEFWQAFKTVTDYSAFKEGAVELYVDLTFGYRIQPMLIFLASFFLNETNEDIRIKKIFYGMEQAEPPHILDMTELLYLLEWLKSAQMFVRGGSARELVNNLRGIAEANFQEVAVSFEEFTDAYAFNYVSYLNEKAKIFNDYYNGTEFKKHVKEKYPVIGLIHPFINDFIRIFTSEEKLFMQLEAALKNFNDGAYSRSVIILRETFITAFMEAFGFRRNKDRKRIGEFLINRVYWSLDENRQDSMLTDKEKYMAGETYRLLSNIFGEQDVEVFYKYWGKIREIRNGSGHIKNIHKENKIDFSELKKELEFYINAILQLMKRMSQKFPKALEYKEQINALMDSKFKARLFVIVNEGLHPILPKLKEQYGKQIDVEVLTTGNVDLNAEKEIAQKCRKIAEQYHDRTIYLTPSGFPYLAVAAYNVLQQTLAKHPVWLQYDRESNRYVEKNLDPRELIV